MNNLNYEAYSNMLTIQANMCFPFEYGLYVNLGLENMKKIGEIGCGNTSFIKKIGDISESANFYCYDYDQEILNYANNTDQRFRLKLGSVEDINENLDVLFLRLILHQVEDIETFISNSSDKLVPGSHLVIIDTYDQDFQLFPSLPKFLSSLQKHRKTFSPGKASRNLFKDVINICMNNGFQLTNENRYFVPSSLDGYKEYFRDYMLETGRIFGLSKESEKEIFSWYKNKFSYAQIGLFACSFIKL